LCRHTYISMRGLDDRTTEVGLYLGSPPRCRYRRIIITNQLTTHYSVTPDGDGTRRSASASQGSTSWLVRNINSGQLQPRRGPRHTFTPFLPGFGSRSFRYSVVDSTTTLPSPSSGPPAARRTPLVARLSITHASSRRHHCISPGLSV
jgi:hypothetical protein